MEEDRRAREECTLGCLWSTGLTSSMHAKSAGATVIWHPLAGLKSPQCCGGSTSNPRKTPIDPVGQLQRVSTSNETQHIDGREGED